MKLFPRLEFHRTGIGLLPDAHDPEPGSAVHLANVAGSKRPLTFCSCSAGRRSGCRHLKQLEGQIRELHGALGGSWFDLFTRSGWFRLAQRLFQDDLPAASDCSVLQEQPGGAIRLFTPGGVEALRYLEQSPSVVRFLERIGKLSAEISTADRSGLLERLSTFMRTPEEQHLNKAGMQTNRQFFERSLWCRVAYHALREYGDIPGGGPGMGELVKARIRLEPAVDLRSGSLFLKVRVDSDEAVRFQIAVPRRRVADALELLAETGQASVVPLPAADLFYVGPDTRIEKRHKLDVLRLAAEGEEILDDPGRSRFRYGDLVFLEELGVLVRRSERGDGSWREPKILGLELAGIGTFRSDEPASEPSPTLAENPLASLGILTEFDYIEIAPEGEDEDDDLLSIRYGFGSGDVGLNELLEAKRTGQPYLETASGWIDLNAPALRNLGSLPDRREARGGRTGVGSNGDAGRVRLSSAELLRLQASSAAPIRVEGEGDRTDFLRRFLALRPADPLVEPEGLKSILRPYQRLGVEWLKFLYENGLAGLLCDDMGLGKTHQAMALMVILREQLAVDLPILVVCPRTVISHWRNKLREYAPVLRSVYYHGPHRDLEESLAQGDVVLTSYGVMRNDVERFGERLWGLVVFDEVQQIKNRSTQGYRAAVALSARMKLGLTGTPIENSLTELKGLFDLVLPGYLGGDDSYVDFMGPNELDADSWYAVNLRRLTAPFVLRRVKTAVLDELPEKIEDIRTCRLSEEQFGMYRQTIETKGAALMKTLRSERGSLPYIHIFALLNMLKQICDHPALAVNDLDRYENYESGKWDLCKELLEESFDSGQKVVVFTQYLGMIAILQRHLTKLGIDYVTLTGSTRERGKVVDRFNNDDDCRVFLGSLKAGGTGIDLVGGSVVIHYDRWWNAAREDQATDRLYRIGQKRVVHVFKLITEETLEERIAAIIDRKRRLMESVVQEDDPRLNKIFSREELIELLQGPGLEEPM
ncbi:MAG: DEAD/DEAH box helicase [Acidobacteria bacterium]|nr:DEAD/DEAH box helicase [Acidobacteriota bacterium]